MEKYTQFRDRASGIAPFLPVGAQAPSISLVLHLFLFSMRLPFFVSACIAYFGFLQWLPMGSLGKKASLWVILGIPGIWWVDLQIDGVRKGSLSKHSTRLPQPGTVIASSFTSPVDALYLAAIFDPIFTISYPSTRKVQRISLIQAILRAFAPPERFPPPEGALTDLATLIRDYPNRCVAVFPECTTTNGKGILQLSPSLVTARPSTKVFPISLRYTPADVTTPVPDTYFSFIWNLLSKPKHCIRVRIAGAITVGATGGDASSRVGGSKSGSGSSREGVQSRRSYDYNYFDTLDDRLSTERPLSATAEKPLTDEQKSLLFQVGDALGRLGRISRVGFGVEEKQEFVSMWAKSKRN